MTNVELRTVLKSWIDKIINVEGGESLMIIASHQNAPAPAKPYITIRSNPTREIIGRPCKGDVDSTGHRKLVDDELLTFEIWEEGGDGERLDKLVRSTERQDVISDFSAHKIAYMGNGDVINVPRLQEDDWIKQSMVEIRLGIGELTIEDSSWMDTVEYHGTIGGNSV